MVLVLDGATAAGLDPDGSAPGLSVWSSGRSCRPSRLLRSIRTRSWRPNNYSEIHLNSYQTDTFSVPGPASFAHQTVQQRRISPLGGIAGSIAVDASGQLVTIRVGPQRTRERAS